MIDEQLRVLKAMSEITKRVDLTEFAKIVDLTPDQAMEALKELTKEGYVRSSRTGNSITEKGRAVLKAVAPVPMGMEFIFYTEIGKPTEFAAVCVRDFCEVVKGIATASLEFHLYREDFENWTKTTLKDEDFSSELGRIRQAGLKGEALRKEMAAVIEARFGL